MSLQNKCNINDIPSSLIIVSAFFINIKFAAMRVKNIYLLVIMLVSFGYLNSKELMISPNRPKPFNELNISINSNSNDEKKAYIYCFIEGKDLPLLTEADLQKPIGGFNYSCKFIVPEKTVYIVIRSNENDVKPIMSLIYDAKEKPVKFSKYTESLYHLASLPTMPIQLMNYDSAIFCLNEEVRLYPDNQLAKLALYSQYYDLKMINVNQLDSLIYDIYLHSDLKNEQMVSALCKGLSIVNRGELADSLKKSIIFNNPRGKLAEDNYIEKLNEKEDARDYIESADIFLKLFPNSDRKNEVIGKMAQLMISDRSYEKCEALMSQYGFYPPEQALYLAFMYLEKEQKPQKAENLFQKIIYALKYIPDSLRSSITTKADWKAQVNNSLAEVYRAYGEYNFQTKQKEIALNNFISAYNTFAEIPPKLYEDLALYYYKYRMDDKALDISKEAILNSKASEKVYTIFDKLYEESKTNIKESNFLDSLELMAKYKRIEELKKNKINKSIKMPVLMDADELMIDMSVFKGDVIVMELFASWCQPCEKSFTSLMSISDKNYDPKVKIFAVSVWENAKVNLENYQNTDFNGIKIFFDERNIIAKEVGVKGLPVRLFFDKQGKLQFAETGTIGNKEDINRTKDIIELLTKE